MGRKNPQLCKNVNCDHIVNYSKTGFCYKCSLNVRKKPERKMPEKIKCKSLNCDNLVSIRSLRGLCSMCYKPTPKKYEKNITYICPNPDKNDNCLRGVLVNKYGFKEAIKRNQLCKKCGHLKGVEVRKANGTYATTKTAKLNISRGLKKSYEKNNYIVWNKGLSAETDERVAKTGKSRPGELNPMHGRSFRDIWKTKYSEEEFNFKIDYNSYLKSQSSLTFENWKGKRQLNNTAFDDYKQKVWHFTNKQDIKNLPNYNKRGKSGIEGAYHLDHIVSIKFGFERDIKPEYIGSIDNLWFIPWEINIKKSNPKIFLCNLQEYYFYDAYGFDIEQRMNHIMHNKWNVPLPKLQKIN